MSDPFLDDESSIEGAQPVEFYEITQSSLVTYFVASGSRDLDFPVGFTTGSGLTAVFHLPATYVATPMARTEITANTTTDQGALTLALALSHPFAQRWTALGSPPTQPSIVIYRMETNGNVEQIKSGVIVSMSMDGHRAKFMIQPPLARLLTRRLPVLNADTQCEHVLYDRNCRANRAAFSLGVSGGITSSCLIEGFDGRTITISTIGGQPDHWAQLGEFVHLETGERMTILDQVGTQLTLQAPIPGLVVGDAVSVSAGCRKDIVTCRVTFGNQVNFSGFPQLPTTNPFIPTGLGVVEEQE